MVDGPVPAPFLAPTLPKAAAPAPAAEPLPAADETSPISFLIKGITDLANRTGGRRLAQQPPQQPGPQANLQAQQPAQQPAQPQGYRNPQPLITVEPHVLIDQKNEKSFLQSADIVFQNGQRIPLPAGFNLPTTGLWHQLLDIPQVFARLFGSS